MAERKINSIRIPPQSVDAEMALLGSIMLRPEAIYEVLDTVSQSSFYFEKHRIIFDTMLEFLGKNTPIDLLSMSSRLKEKNLIDQVGGASYLTELVNIVPSSANIKHYGEIVQKKHMMRSLIEASEYISHLGFDEAGDLPELLEKAEKRIFEVTNFGSIHKFIELKETLAEAWERLDMLHNSKNILRGVPTGFPELDSRLAGLQPSDLIIIAGRPSMGKTSLALDIARQTAVNHKTPVGIFSLEMSSQQLVDRMLAAQSSVDAWKLRTGKLSREEDFAAIRRALDELATAPIFIDDQPGNNILKMRSVARRLKREKGLGLIIVDYLQLMLPTNSRGNDSLVQQVTEISRSLKNLARELNIPVLALSQLSRAVEQRGGRPRLSDLRDSGCLAGDTLITDSVSGKQYTIKELAFREKQKPISILSADKRHIITPQTMVKVFPSGKKPVYRLTTQSGRIIKATANHPFLALEGWRRLDKLLVGGHIAVPRTIRISAPPNPLHQDELILLAHLLGDGCILPRQPYHYTSASEKNLDAVASAARSLFGINGRLVSQKNWFHLYLSSPIRLARGKKHPITAWFEKLQISRVRSYEKRIPAAVMECDEEHIALFLRHLWSTDGNLSWKRLNGRKPAAAIYYASSSQVLARQVQHLLLRLGMRSALRVSKSAKGYRAMYHVVVESAPEQLFFLKKVGIADEREEIVPILIKALEEIMPNTNVDGIPKEAWHFIVRPEKDRLGWSWRKFQAELGTVYNGSALMATGISRTRMAAIGALLKSESCVELATSDILWDKITSIEPLGVEDVYDATVPSEHNFVANDIIAHNSIEQDADVVMFIHREDKYKENSDKPNIAEILIEKHRNGPTGKIELYFNDSRSTFQSLNKSDFGGAEKDSESF